MAKRNRSPRSTPKVIRTIRGIAVNECVLPAAVAKTTVEELAVSEFSLVNHDGFISYGPVSNYFHHATSEGIKQRPCYPESLPKATPELSKRGL